MSDRNALFLGLALVSLIPIACCIYFIVLSRGLVDPFLRPELEITTVNDHHSEPASAALVIVDLATAPPFFSMSRPLMRVRVSDQVRERHRWVLIKDDPGLLKQILNSAAGRSEFEPAPSQDLVAMTPLMRRSTFMDLHVSIPTPGQYRYLCVVPGHAERGLQGTLLVTGRPPTEGELVFYRNDIIFQAVQAIVAVSIIAGFAFWLRRKLRDRERNTSG